MNYSVYDKIKKTEIDSLENYKNCKEFTFILTYENNKEKEIDLTTEEANLYKKIIICRFLKNNFSKKNYINSFTKNEYSLIEAIMLINEFKEKQEFDLSSINIIKFNFSELIPECEDLEFIEYLEELVVFIDMHAKITKKNESEIFKIITEYHYNLLDLIRRNYHTKLRLIVFNLKNIIYLTNEYYKNKSTFDLLSFFINNYNEVINEEYIFDILKNTEDEYELFIKLIDSALNYDNSYYLHFSAFKTIDKYIFNNNSINYLINYYNNCIDSKKDDLLNIFCNFYRNINSSYKKHQFDYKNLDTIIRNQILLKKQAFLNYDILYIYLLNNNVFLDSELLIIYGELFFDDIDKVINLKKNISEYLKNLDDITFYKILKKYNLYYCIDESLIPKIVNPVYCTKKMLKVLNLKRLNYYSQLRNFENIIFETIKYYNIDVCRIIDYALLINLPYDKIVNVMGNIDEDKVKQYFIS